MCLCHVALCGQARFRNLIGYHLPFDRHDWVVDRCGTEVRYVIDYYQGKPDGTGKPVAVHIDARPALDSPRAYFDRLRNLVFGPPADDEDAATKVAE